MCPLISAAILQSGMLAKTRFMNEWPVRAMTGRPPAWRIACSTFMEHFTS